MQSRCNRISSQYASARLLALVRPRTVSASVCTHDPRVCVSLHARERRIVWRAPLVTEFSTVVRYRPRRIMAYANWVDKKKPVPAAHESRGRDEKNIYIGSPEITLTRWMVLFSFFLFFFRDYFPRFRFARSSLSFLIFFSLNHLHDTCKLRRIIFRLQPDDAVFSGDSRRVISAFRYGDANMEWRHDDDIVIRSDDI